MLCLDGSLGTHANGDVGIATTLRVYERLQKESPRHDPRFRLEHCTVVNDDLVARIKKLGAIPTPFSTYVYYHGEKMKYYGAERLNHMTPAASDSPAEPVVCTILFSRMVERPKARRMLMESTEMGMEAETVSPARRPT